VTGHIREELGAFVLGAIDPADDDRVRAHLAACAECRREHERLQGLPVLLDLLPAQPSTDLATPPAGMEDTVLAGLRPARRRRWRPGAASRRWGGLPSRPSLALGSGLAGAAAAVGILAFTGSLETGTEQTDSVTLAAPGSPARATAVLRTKGAGTHVALRVQDLPPTRGGEVYEVWFVRGDGRVSAGTFALGGDGEADLELSTAATADGYERIGITREPDGLDPARNGPNVLAARLPG
jgi:hypothetical protein